jgi:sRNA-binding protein
MPKAQSSRLARDCLDNFQDAKREEKEAKKREREDALRRLREARAKKASSGSRAAQAPTDQGNSSDEHKITVSSLMVRHHVKYR